MRAENVGIMDRVERGTLDRALDWYLEGLRFESPLPTLTDLRHLSVLHNELE